MFPVPIPSTQRSLPARRESLAASKAAAFSQIEEELRDVRRVHSQGQEEDLRMALSRTISRVEELSLLLKDAYQMQTDLQTELTLAKSNLQLALANNEMLEDALKRDGPGHSKDVGWRRWSAREHKEREMAESRRQSMDSVRSVDTVPQSPALRSPMPVPSPNPSVSEGRFFKFRFGNSGSASSPGNASPQVPGDMSPHPTNHASHLTSASLPSLVPVKETAKELEELNGQLEKEKENHKATLAAKEALEAELESLSQALFEEANKMVAEERMKRAEAEEELNELKAEKEALRSALRLVEKERSELSSGVNSPAPEYPTAAKSTPIHHAHKRSTSSAIAIKSPVEAEFDTGTSSRPGSRMSIQSTSSTRAPAPAPLDLPQVGLASESLRESAQKSVSSPEVPEVTVEVASPPEPTPSPSPTASPTPSAAQFVYTPTRPLPFYDGEESPWADVRSASSAT